MIRTICYLCTALAVLDLVGFIGGQERDPSVDSPTLVERLQSVRERHQRLGKQLDTLRRLGVRDPVLPDVEIYWKAVEWALRHDEVPNDESVRRLESVVDRGLLRATQVSRGESPWLQVVNQPVPRGFRSRIDGSLQPYAVTYPAEYGRNPRAKWRLDVVLHGRDPALNEVKFLFEHSGDQPLRNPASHVVLHIFGRGNLGYRWAAETDVWEAIDYFVAVERSLGRDWLDVRRVVLKGFSMGGAGAWHLGLHRPDRWAAVAPGAGFVTTRGYLKSLPPSIPEYVEKCLTIYDSVEYAANAVNLPIVAFAGLNDPQHEAVRLMHEKLADLKTPFSAMLAPGLGHSFPAEWQQKVEREIVAYLQPELLRSEYPERVLFHTYTLKYPGTEWVEILGMERHYQRAEIDASFRDNKFVIQTKNIRALRILLPPGLEEVQTVQIDNQSILAYPAGSALGTPAIHLQKVGGAWESVLPQRLTTQRLRQLQKIAGTTGPIDDAFTDAFLCVRGTELPWHSDVTACIDRRLEEFRRLWSRYFRGDLPVKNDNEVTDEEIATRHLILFGDPASNRLLREVVRDLPISWTKESVLMDAKSFDARQHFPVLIFPSPLNPSRYVVINSGHTFGEKELAGSNAWLFPHLGDFAVLKVDGKSGEVAHAGLFDDFWTFPKQRLGDETRPREGKGR